MARAHKNPRIDAYIEKSAPYARPILRRLRALVHRGCPEVVETIKWGMPHFDHEGILCGMAAFKAHCAFGFWRGDLIVADAKRDEAMGQFGCIRTLADLPPDRVIVDYVRKAARLNENGIEHVPRSKPAKKPIRVPADLRASLERNARARATFDHLSPSQRRDYVEWITEAKTKATRERRLTTAIDWLTEGKPRNWKYMKGKPLEKPGMSWRTTGRRVRAKERS